MGKRNRIGRTLLKRFERETQRSLVMGWGSGGHIFNLLTPGHRHVYYDTNTKLVHEPVDQTSGIVHAVGCTKLSEDWDKGTLWDGYKLAFSDGYLYRVYGLEPDSADTTLLGEALVVIPVKPRTQFYWLGKHYRPIAVDTPEPNQYRLEVLIDLRKPLSTM